MSEQPVTPSVTLLTSSMPPAMPQVSDMTDDPARLIRMAGMLRGLLDEMRELPLDDAARERLSGVRERALAEICSAVEDPLKEELSRLELPLNDDGPPSSEELRVAQAQLVGWLTGLFNGVQASMQLAQVQAQQRARGLTGGSEQPQRPSPGQYL